MNQPFEVVCFARIYLHFDHCGNVLDENRATS